MASNFGSFSCSPLGAFVRSALSARGGSEVQLMVTDILLAAPDFQSHVCELDTADFSLIRRQIPSVLGESEELGGGNGKDFLYLSDANPDPNKYWFKCNLDDFSYVFSGLTTASSPRGIGGNKDTVRGRGNDLLRGPRDHRRHR